MMSVLLLACGLLTACSGSTRDAHTSIAKPRATPTAMLTLPPLTAEIGWHVVLTLDNVSSGANLVAASGNFAAPHPYKLFFACQGAGTLRVAYPQANETAPCSGTPEVNGTQEFPPSGGSGQVTISASTKGTVTFEVMAEMQNA